METNNGVPLVVMEILTREGLASMKTSVFNQLRAVGNIVEAGQDFGKGIL